MLVEGAEADRKLMKKLFRIYGLEERHQIVPYRTNIHALYNSAFKEKNIEDVDLFLHLKERATDQEKRDIFAQRQRYTDIVLIFDLDPQDEGFCETATAVREMSEHFTDSTDMGKLYINYPMVEAFYHLKDVPDPDYENQVATLEELEKGEYKSKVNQESKSRSSKRLCKACCNTIIWQNLEKARKITEEPYQGGIVAPEQTRILDKQLKKLNTEKEVFVLSTCAFYIVDFNPALIESCDTNDPPGH